MFGEERDDCSAIDYLLFSGCCSDMLSIPVGALGCDASFDYGTPLTSHIVFLRLDCEPGYDKACFMSNGKNNGKDLPNDLCSNKLIVSCLVRMLYDLS